MNQFIVVAYYTSHPIYVKHCSHLVESLKKFNIEFHIEQIQDLGSWQRNTQFKPRYIKSMLDKYPEFEIVYTDIDSVFMSYPILFETIKKSIAVHIYDRSLYKNKSSKKEALSGTIFFKNNKTVHLVIEDWISECQRLPNQWDQRCLDTVLKTVDYEELPPQYCCIFDTMACVENKVIVHNQASREYRVLHKR